jgi:quercetin dioxygenase-like cupin family protein
MTRIQRTSALVIALGLLGFSSATLAEQAAKPAEKAAKPAEKAAKPTEQTAKPADQAAKPAAKPPAPKHVLKTPDQMEWGPAPEALPAGAQMAVLDGDPGKAGVPFALRAKFPAGYRVPPHSHPNDENVVVISGEFMVGMGDKMDEATMQTLPAGSYAKVPRRMHHYAQAKGDTVIQIYGTGPFAITYVNPGDDPRKAKK